MLTPEKNQRLTRVGAETSAGELLRRYWHPVGATSDLEVGGVRKVRLLSEDLVLYRDFGGNLGLIAERCPHRSASLEYAIPEADGIRCPYHGWKFDNAGSCIDQPNESPNSTFKDRISTPAYAVEELGGLIFAYLGPRPAPLLPRFDLLVEDGGIRGIGWALLPCNWLQIMENSVDPVHAEWLHGNFFDYIEGRQGRDAPKLLGGRKHVEIGFDVFEHGIVKRRVLEGGSKDDEQWTVGHPLVFPNFLKTGGQQVVEFQYRVPVDDETTLHMWYTLYRPPADADYEPQTLNEIPYFEVPFRHEDGSFIVDFAPGQDIMAWITQGSVADRSQEHLGESDKGIIMYRQLLSEQMKAVESGKDPLGVIRDVSLNDVIRLPTEVNKLHYGGQLNVELTKKHARHNPDIQLLTELFASQLRS